MTNLPAPELNRTVLATVRPLGDLRIVQAATEGTVKSIKVKENQVVKQGEAMPD